MVTKKKSGRPKLKAKERHTERETVSFTKTEMKRLKEAYRNWDPAYETSGKSKPGFAVFLRELLTSEIWRSLSL